MAIVSRHPDRHVVDTALGAIDHDVILVEPTEHAYPHIGRLKPDLIIVCLSGDDMHACQVLSMLTLDRQTSSTPVLTHITAPSDAALEAGVASDGPAERFSPAVLN